jgi:16S rRNA (adenine1518-N6/adenine1519-N6)-dimethyltransferase
MILTHPTEVCALLKRLGVRPNRTLGQNFLIDANVLRILLETAQLDPHDTVLEVGAGLGVLTEWLARRAAMVVAVEKDPRLVAYLRERFRAAPNVKLVEADVMDLSMAEWLATPIHKIVANLPYSIASRLLFAVAESPLAPERVTVTVQKEVAERVSAQPGGRDYGLLSVVVQLRYHAEKVRDVGATCFLPPPDVQSSILNLTRRESLRTAKDPARWRDLLKGAFGQRRKQIQGLLERRYRLGRAAAQELLENAGIPASWRPEMIAPEQWVRLSDALADILPLQRSPPSDRQDA